MTSTEVSRLVEDELKRIADPQLIARIRELLVVPSPVERAWDYGVEGEQFTCWTVLEHQPSNTGIAFCSQGFGPSYPWGMVFLSGPDMNIGMDCQWYASLEDAMRNTMAWDGPNPPGYEIS